MKNFKKNTLGLTLLIVGFIIATLGIAYAVMVVYDDITGTNNHSLVLGDIYMYYNETNQLSLENAMPSEGPDETKYFEFTISGKNTYTKQDIYYEIVLDHGEDHETRTERIKDSLLKFRLVEIKDNQETIVLDNESYDSLNNQRIWVNTINKNTQTDIEVTYRLYMWIDYNTVIGNTKDADYDMNTWNNQVYGSIKVNVIGDFNKKGQHVNFVNAVKSKYGSDTTLIAVNTEGDLYDATNQEQEIREYRYSGPTANNYVYFDTNGNGTKDTNEVWRVVGVFKDTVKDEDGNVVLDSQGNPTYEEEVKLVRNTMLQLTEMPTSYLINGTTYTIKSSGVYAYWNSTKVGTNYNDWTTAGLQYYLNTEKDETDTSDGTTTANAGYLSLLTSEAKEMISPTTYYLGNVYYGVDTVKNAYIQERGTVECASSVTSYTQNNNCNIWYGNQASWDGLIGLMYPSDYGYSASDLYWETDMSGWKKAESDGVYARSTSWLYQTANYSTFEWLLSPSSFDSRSAVGWYFTGNVSFNHVNDGIGARPVLNLKSQAKVIDGAGTLEDPFVIVTE